MTVAPQSAFLHTLTRSPLAKGLLWVSFAAVFCSAGLAFTTWLLEPETFPGGARWVLVAVFPLLVPAFFAVNRILGCGAGACPGTRPGARRSSAGSVLIPYQRPPG